MTRISLGNMNIDPRSSYDKLSRSEIRRILAKNGINHDPQLKKVDGIKILQANKIDPMKEIEWEQVTIKDGSGNDKIKMEPKRTAPHRPEGYDELALAKIDELSQKAIDDEKEKLAKLEADKAINRSLGSLLDEFKGVKEILAQLLDEREKANQKEAKVETTSVKKITDLNKIHWKKFQKMAKDIGETWTTKEPRDPIIERLENQSTSE